MLPKQRKQLLPRWSTHIKEKGSNLIFLAHHHRPKSQKPEKSIPNKKKKYESIMRFSGITEIREWGAENHEEDGNPPGFLLWKLHSDAEETPKCSKKNIGFTRCMCVCETCVVLLTLSLSLSLSIYLSIYLSPASKSEHQWASEVLFSLPPEEYTYSIPYFSSIL